MHSETRVWRGIRMVHQSAFRSRRRQRLLGKRELPDQRLFSFTHTPERTHPRHSRHTKDGRGSRCPEVKLHLGRRLEAKATARSGAPTAAEETGPGPVCVPGSGGKTTPRGGARMPRSRSRSRSRPRTRSLSRGIIGPMGVGLLLPEELLILIRVSCLLCIVGVATRPKCAQPSSWSNAAAEI